MKKLAFPILVFILVCAVDVSARQRVSALSFAPANSVGVLKVNWNQVRSNAQLRNIVKGDDFERIINQFGLETSNVSEWVMFADINPSPNTGAGVIITGNFSANSIRETVLTKNWVEEKLAAQTVYVNPADNSYLSPLRNGLVIAGTKAGVEKSLKTISNPRGSIARQQPFASLFSQLGTSFHPIGFAIGIPQDYQAVADIAVKVTAKLLSFTGLGPLGTILEKLGLVRALGFSVTTSKKGYPVQLVAMMNDEITASLASGGLNLLKNLSASIAGMRNTQQNREAIEALKTMLIINKGAMISVSFSMPEKAMVR